MKLDLPSQYREYLGQSTEGRFETKFGTFTMGKKL